MRLRDLEGRFKSPKRSLQRFNEEIRIVDEGGAHTIPEIIALDDMYFWSKTKSAPLPSSKNKPLAFTKTAAHVLFADIKSIGYSILNP